MAHTTRVDEAPDVMRKSDPPKASRTSRALQKEVMRARWVACPGQKNRKDRVDRRTAAVTRNFLS